MQEILQSKQRCECCVKAAGLPIAHSQSASLMSTQRLQVVVVQLKLLIVQLLMEKHRHCLCFLKQVQLRQNLQAGGRWCGPDCWVTTSTGSAGLGPSRPSQVCQNLSTMWHTGRRLSDGLPACTGALKLQITWCNVVKKFSSNNESHYMTSCLPTHFFFLSENLIWTEHV